MSNGNFKSAARAIQYATGWSYRRAQKELRERDGNGKPTDENVAEIIDAEFERKERDHARQ